MMTASDEERVQPALHALLSGDVDGLRAALEADPGVVNLRVGENTMLEWMTQPEGGAPSPEMVQVLIDAGAYLDRALNLAGCWNLADLCTPLLAAGADPAARADAGITPLESAAMHSSTEAADVLVAHGLHRPSLWLAAASGLLAEVQQWVSPDGSLQADPGPYRPNWADVGRSAGPPPSDDPADIVGEALVFAALNNRREVVDYLLDSGADIDARPYQNTTALHFAVQFQRSEMVRHLLDRGASAAIHDASHNSDASAWAQACDDGSAAAASIKAMVGMARTG
jgi:ankyrin repeat protein